MGDLTEWFAGSALPIVRLRPCVRRYRLRRRSAPLSRGSHSHHVYAVAQCGSLLHHCMRHRDAVFLAVAQHIAAVRSTVRYCIAVTRCSNACR